MRCQVVKDGETTLYQEGELGLLLNPWELMAFVKEKIGGPDVLPLDYLEV